MQNNNNEKSNPEALGKGRHSGSASAHRAGKLVRTDLRRIVQGAVQVAVPQPPFLCGGQLHPPFQTVPQLPQRCQAWGTGWGRPPGGQE